MLSWLTLYLLELKSAVAVLLIFLGSWRSWVYFKALVMSDRAKRLVRDAWDGKQGGGEGGRNYFMFLASHGFTARFRDCAAQSTHNAVNGKGYWWRYRLIGKKEFQGGALKRKGTISVKLWPWTIPLQLYPVRQTLTLIAYEMSMHPNPFVVGCTGGITKESSSTLVWSPGASSCSFFRM